MNEEEKYLPNYLYVFPIAYGLSAFVGAAFFPIIFEIEYSAINYIAGLGLFLFFGFLMWPIFAPYNAITYFIFSILAFLFFNIVFEYIILVNKNGGDLPLDESGLLKRLKRARVMFILSVIVTLVISAVFINRINTTTIEFYDAGYQEGYQDGVRTAQEENRSEEGTASEWVYVTGSGEKYHKKGCQYVTNKSERLSLEDALDKGYEPCSRCW